MSTLDSFERYCKRIGGIPERTDNSVTCYLHDRTVIVDISISELEVYVPDVRRHLKKVRISTMQQEGDFEFFTDDIIEVFVRFFKEGEGHVSYGTEEEYKTSSFYAYVETATAIRIKREGEKLTVEVFKK
ncbi:MAG: hypothetical protein DRJ40_08035 [Thermoprotei archaeon]|nr:MAG: hypothetical protein DRJ40_08035 [Thermoprotei archaeon]